jgi:hypothetical protein
MARLRLVSLALCLLALGVASCGGGDDSSSSSSKSEFTKNVEQICKDTQNRLRDVGSGGTTPTAIADAADKVINESKDSVARLKSLDLPGGSSHQTAQNFVNATTNEIEDEGIPALEHLRDALRAKDAAATRKAVQELRAIKTGAADKYAKELGATACVG